MGGAEFVRADLHVHTLPDVDSTVEPPIEEFIDAALGNGVKVLGITDHHRTDRALRAVDAAHGRGLLVLPGVEVSTNDGHLLALFSPDHPNALTEFATAGNLQMVTTPDGSRRSQRSMVDLVAEIDRRGGLAIAAHVDVASGAAASMPGRALAALVASPALAALEFRNTANLNHWFTPTDSDNARRTAWMGRVAEAALRERGLARITSSDAHTPDLVGEDRAARTLTRLRLDDLNFIAVRNAIVNGPRARCKAEATLPPSYPRLLRAGFEGGFLSGVELDFSANLNCFIGGRGSGKSTALIAIRAAVGDELDLEQGDDPDDEDRMPDRTYVDFVDRFGTERRAVRERGGEPHEEGANTPISLPLQGFAQDESGRIAREYDSNPSMLLSFIDQFVDLDEIERRESELLSELATNAALVKSMNEGLERIPKVKKVVDELTAQLTAAEKSRLEEVAKWASILTAEGPLITRIRDAIQRLKEEKPEAVIDLDAMAEQSGVEPKRTAEFLNGDAGLRIQLAQLHAQRQRAGEGWVRQVADAAEPAMATVRRWQEDHDDLQRRLRDRERELAEQGLRVQLGEVRRVATQLDANRKAFTQLLERKRQYDRALRERGSLLDQLGANQEARFERRRATLTRVRDQANRNASGLTIHLRHERTGIVKPWEDWLTRWFKFRTPRVERVAAALTPRQMANHLLEGDVGGLSGVRVENEQFFDQQDLRELVQAARTWENIFDLDTMRLKDRVYIELREPEATSNRPFGHLSAGQQRSVLLSLLLCAEGNAPLILDQPEDHLDASYIASALVGHLESVKERRQLIIATHSPNLTVLGDAELVIPMYAEAGHGAPRDSGAVDRATTRDRVCELLEGGADAFRRRGQRYGFRVELAAGA